MDRKEQRRLLKNTESIEAIKKARSRLMNERIQIVQRVFIEHTNNPITPIVRLFLTMSQSEVQWKDRIHYNIVKNYSFS